MKHVTFTRDMKPQRAGEMRLLPDDVAAQLEADGAIEPNPPSWPAGSENKPAEAKPSRRSRMMRGRELLGQTYLTK